MEDKRINKLDTNIDSKSGEVDKSCVARAEEQTKKFISFSASKYIDNYCSNSK